MDALGFTINNDELFWHGRSAGENVLEEFIATKIARARFPFLQRARKLRLLYDSIEYEIKIDDTNGAFFIEIHFYDKYGIIDIEYKMYSDLHEYFQVSAQYKDLGCGDNLSVIPGVEAYLAVLGKIQKYKKRLAQ